MPSSIIADCGHRERKGMVRDGECRDCRGVACERSDYATHTDDPHAARRSRQRVIDNAVNNGGSL